MPDTHMATIGLVRVAPTGKVYLSVTGDEQIKERLNFTTEHRIFPDSSNGNTAGYPTIQAYLALENAGGYGFKQITQGMLFTEK